MPTKSRCPYCSKTYQFSTAYWKHIEREHPDLPINSHVQRAQNISQLQGDALESSGDHYEPIDSDFDSQYGSTNETYAELAPEPTTFPDAGSPIRALTRPFGVSEDIWAPFTSHVDFKLARWFIESRTPKEQVDKFFKDGLQPPGCSIKSAYSLYETVDRMDWGIGVSTWKSGMVSFDSYQTDSQDTGEEIRQDVPKL